MQRLPIKPMNHFTLNNDDIKTCIELACDGVNIHLQDQSKLDVIHKIMYAVAEAAQSDQAVATHLKANQVTQYAIRINPKVQL